MTITKDLSFGTGFSWQRQEEQDTQTVTKLICCYHNIRAFYGYDH